jgi:hypothetical protein
MATIDFIDYYLGALLPSPESVRIDVSSISIPTFKKLGLLPFLHHSHGKPVIFCDALKTVPGLPQSGLLSQLRLVALLTQHWFSKTSTPILFRHHTHSTAFTLVVDDFLVRYSHPSELDQSPACLPSMNSKFIEIFPTTPTLAIPLTILAPHPHSVRPSPCLTTSLPCCLISVLRGVVRHHHRPSTPRLYLIPTYLHTPHPHPSPPFLPQSPPQKRHGSNK